MELTNIHPAEAYLRNEQNPSFLYIRIYGERRKLFINRGGENAIGIIAKGKRKRNRKLLLKYQRLARLATHTNNWLRKIAAADPEKSLYENHITTGTVIDGMCISLARIEKYCGSTSMALFRKALKDGKTFSTSRFDFCGYDGTLWCEPDGEGGMKAGFSKEYRDCGNGYYYLLINDKFMIGYDID